MFQEVSLPLVTMLINPNGRNHICAVVYFQFCPGGKGDPELKIQHLDKAHTLKHRPAEE